MMPKKSRIYKLGDKDVVRMEKSSCWVGVLDKPSKSFYE